MTVAPRTAHVAAFVAALALGPFAGPPTGPPSRLYAEAPQSGRPQAAQPSTARTSPRSPTIAQFLSPASPIEVVAARTVDRLAWIAYEEGKRNIYTGAPPAFTPVRLTNFTKDDGVDMTAVTISADGSTVVFVRGTATNRVGWNANPSGSPEGGEQSLWAVRVAAPGVAWRVAAGANPQLSPDGRSVVFVREGQMHRAIVSPVRPTTPIDRGEAPFIRSWGTNSAPTWSPDGRKIAFVSNRVNHGFVVVYDVATRAVTYMAPSVDFDTNPVWSPDSRRVIFARRPGTPFAQQSQTGGGGVGLPAGPAAARAGGAAGAQGRGGAARGGTADAAPQIAQSPGLATAPFRGGYNFALWSADAASGEGREFWRPDPANPTFTTINNFRAAGNHLVFTIAQAGGRGGRGGARAGGPTVPIDEWERYYSLDVTKDNARPVLLTTTEGIIEDTTSIAIAPDGKTFFYCTNAGDRERRHIWSVPVAGGTPRQVTGGAGIETGPAPLASNRTIATLSATWNMPQSLGVWTLGAASSATTSTQRVVFPRARPGFPTAAHVEPQLVVTHPADKAFEIPNQLFLPKDIRPGERRPAIVFVHGGPQRQMLLGYHYRHVYHLFYAVNQYLASRGYVVLSINFRSGVGYGRSFRTAPNTGQAGNSEYQDVLAGAEYLRTRADVDPKRIGIYGLSYGGLLTAQALARNSDIFAAGVDYAGVHLFGSSLDPSSTSYQSSPISQIDKWTSPVLLIHGDDDRNVDFAQTVGLVALLRQRNVYHELIVQPDDVHDSLIHRRWIELLGRTDAFFEKFLGEPATER